MPLSFARLFEDSWNFMRNQPRFSITMIVIFAISQFISERFLPIETLQQDIFSGNLNETSIHYLLLTLGLLLLGIAISNLFLLNIDAISQNKYQQFTANLPRALIATLPIAVLSFIVYLPLSLGAAATFLNNPLLSFPLLISGLYVMIKLVLISYVYLLDPAVKSISDALKTTWTMSRGRMMPLVLLVVISMLPGLINSILSALPNNEVINLVLIIFQAFMAIFMVIFTYRFYQVYKQAV